MEKQQLKDKRKFRNRDSILSDLKSLERTTKSSLEISVSMTSAVVEDLVQRLYREYPEESDQKILVRSRKIICIGRRDI